jgi:probable DNA metabolism protein
MYAVRMPRDAGETDFRKAARHCISLRISPFDVAFIDPDDPSLFPPLPEGNPAHAFNVPRAYGEVLRDAICHSASDRFALLYDVLWKIVHGQRELIANPADATVARLNEYVRNVRRDIHKMHAFLRFRSRQLEGRTLFVAWFQPQHYILRRAVPFFVDRFANMDWLIATPIGTAAWTEGRLVFGPPAPRRLDESDAVLDDLWSTYYRTTFNPARVRLRAMVKEMPRHYWSNMPETSLIPAMVAEADQRVAQMNDRAPDQAPFFAERIAAWVRPAAQVQDVLLDELRPEVSACRRCPLHGPATQAVLGEGPRDAALMFVGEQPGDQEDLTGRPFVGPAGQLLNRALAEAGLDRAKLYLTNAVKHFKYEPRGKRRLHKKPNAGEVSACRWWLDREVALVRPRLVVALGATAASALARHPVSVTRERGPMTFGAVHGFVTVHPSFLLRLPDEASKAAEYSRFITDLRRIRTLTVAEAIEQETPASQRSRRVEDA